MLACAGTDQIVKLYDFEKAQLVSHGVGHSKTVLQLKFSPDDKQIVSVGADGCIFVWNVYVQ